MPLTLRLLEPADEDALRVLFADPDTALWNPGPEPGDLAAWRVHNTEPADDYRTWAVTDDGVFAAIVSVFGLDPATRSGEIGFRTVPAARGHGIARRAVELAIASLVEDGLADRLVLYHAVDNVGSCCVAQACGFILLETLTANHRYGDGELHDEHLHARELT